MDNTTNDSKKLLVLNKSKGYVVTRSDELGRKTVYDLFRFNEKFGGLKT